jgi:Mrp family chromosome partitioning ATPase
MNRAAGVFATPWFHRRHTLGPDGDAATVTEVADWARAPYDDLIESLTATGGNEEGPPRVLFLAPARHGDGTTTAAVMLGACLASRGPTIVLELNFRRPGLAASLGLEEPLGLNGVLHSGDVVLLDREVQETELKNLYALPNHRNGHTNGNGGGNGNGRPLPDLRVLGGILRHLRSRFAHVIVDVAPVLGYVDTPRLAPLADGVVLVVAADATPLDASIAAKKALERAGARVLGAVVTRQRRFVPEIIARRLGEN